MWLFAVLQEPVSTVRRAWKLCLYNACHHLLESLQWLERGLEHRGISIELSMYATELYERYVSSVKGNKQNFQDMLLQPCSSLCL